MTSKFSAFVEIKGIDKISPTLKRVGGKLNGMGKRLESVGRAMTTRVTLPAVALGTGIFRTAVNYERAMNRLGAVTQAGTSDMDRMEKVARRLGQSTVFSATDASKGMALLGQAGFKTEQIVTTIPAVLDLAAAAQIDLGEATSITADVLKGYRFEAGQSARVADVLAQSSLMANTTISELGEAFKMGGAVASAAKQPYETSAAVLASLADKGFKATLGGTAYRQMLLSITDATPKARLALAQLGIAKSDLFSENGEMRNFVDVIGAFERVGAGTNLEALSRIFGARNVGPMAALINDGSEALRTMEAKAFEAQGKSAEVAKEQMKGLPGLIARVSAAWEGLSLSLNKAGFQEFVGTALERLIKWTTKLSESNPKLLRMGLIAIGTSAALGPLTAGLGNVMQALGGTATFIQTVTTLTIGLSRVLVTKVVPAVFLLGKALLATPVGLAITGIAALVGAGYWLWANWSKVTEWLMGAFRGVREFFWDMVDGILSKLEWLIAKLPDSVLDLIGFGEGTVAANIDTSATAAAALPGLQAQQNKARVEIDVRSGNQDVRARLTENDGADIALEQGFALGTPYG